MDWIKWSKLPCEKQWEELQKLDRLSYDHAANWIMSAMQAEINRTLKIIGDKPCGMIELDSYREVLRRKIEGNP